MAKLDQDARVTIKTLARKGLSNRHIARLLGISKGAVRYHHKRMQAQADDGRAHRPGRADAYAEAIDAWREAHTGCAINLTVLHQWLAREHDYPGSLRSVQRYWKRRYPAPKLRARRRIETPPGAQSQTVRVNKEKTFIVRGAEAWGQINPAYRRYGHMLHFHVDAGEHLRRSKWPIAGICSRTCMICSNASLKASRFLSKGC